MKVEDHADPNCPYCNGTGYSNSSTVCQCVLKKQPPEQEFTYFQEWGEWVDHKIDTCRSLLRTLSQLGF